MTVESNGSACNRNPEPQTDSFLRLTIQTGQILALRLVPFLCTIALARYLGAVEFGVYAYVLSWIGILVTISLFGLDRLVVREVAACTTSVSQAQCRALLRWANRLSVCLAAAIAVIALSLHSYLAKRAGIPELALVAAVVITPAVSICTIHQAVLRGVYWMWTSQLPLSVVRPIVTLLVTVTIGALAGLGPTATVAFIGATLAAFAALGTSWRAVTLALPKLRSVTAPYDKRRAWLDSSARLFLLSGLSSLTGTEVILLGASGQLASVGAYAAALQCSAAVSLMLGMVVTVLSPRFAATYAAAQFELLRKLVLRGQIIVVAVGLPMIILLASRGDLALRMLYGPEFVQAETALRVLVAGQLINILAGPVAALLTMTGHERDAVLGVAAAALVNILFALLLVPQWGINGAAIAGMSGTVTWNVVLAWRVKKHLGLIWPFVAPGRQSYNEPMSTTSPLSGESDRHIE